MYVNTINDWMNELADAIENNNTQAIGRLTSISEDWLQMSEERQAQIRLLQSVQDIIEENMDLKNEIEHLEGELENV